MGFWASDSYTPAAKSLYMQVQFFRRWHFALPSMGLIFLRPEASTDTVESKVRQIKQCRKKYFQKFAPWKHINQYQSNIANLLGENFGIVPLQLITKQSSSEGENELFLSQIFSKVLFALLRRITLDKLYSKIRNFFLNIHRDVSFAKGFCAKKIDN
jgi:hypothetical protein